MRTLWMQFLAWMAAVAAALLLAFAAPNEASVMGRLPPLVAKRLDQHTMALPEGLPPGRTLALLTFNSKQRGEIDSWIHGLQLHQDKSISWLKMPVLNDPGDAGRSAIEGRLLSKYPHAWERERLLPVFTNRDAFVRAAGLAGTEHVHVLVVNRHGEVLARAEGEFNEGKGQALRETLLAQNF